VVSGRVDRGLRFGSVKVSVRHAGQAHLTIKPTAAGRSLLARVKRLLLDVAVTFAPTHGRPTMRHLRVTVIAAQ
jgi:DNA-binding transcriptional LysR family regulator